MSRIPHVVRRRQTYYLRVRIPADVAPLFGADYHVKTLRTGDPRRARLEAARALAHAHAVWDEARRMARGLFLGKSIDDLQPQDLRQVDHERARADIELLSQEDRLKLEEKLKKYVGFAERYRDEIKAETEFMREALDAMKHAKLIGVNEGLREAITLGAAIAPSAPLPEEAKRPWNAPELLERFWADKPDISDKTKDLSYGQAFRELKALIGEKPLGEVRRADIKGYAEYLRDRPSSRGGTLDKETISRHLSHVRSLFAWYVESGFIEVNPVEGVVARAAPKPASDDDDEDADGEKRRAFTDAELKSLFDSPLFTGCRSSHRLTKRGDVMIRNERYWFWIIALLTGARTEEITRAPAKLVRVGDIDCIDFRRATKTRSSPRIVPVLPELKRLGFLEWAAAQERNGRRLVEGPDEPARWTKWTNYYLDEIGLDSEEVSPYSLRHVFRQQLRAADLHHELVDKVFGHKGTSVGAGYGRHLSVDEAKLVVERLRPPTPLEHLWTFGQTG